MQIYEDLSRQDLLERCLDEHTSNANESFNLTFLWRLAPNYLISGIKMIKITAFIIASVFNSYYAILKIMETLRITTIEQQYKSFTNIREAERLKRQERCGLSSTKKARTVRKE